MGKREENGEKQEEEEEKYSTAFSHLKGKKHFTLLPPAII